MRIQSNNQDIFYSKYLFKTNNSSKKPHFDGWVRSAANSLANCFTLPNNKLKTYSIEDYKKLNYFDKKILRLEYKLSTNFFDKQFYQNTEVIHDALSDIMKTALDKKYGENQYKVVVIGRSLSSIGKVLGYKIGENNVINIPLSFAKRFLLKDTIKNIDKNEIDVFLKYLSSYGLNKKAVKKSEQKYIITDYCLSGGSLKGATKLFKSNKIWGNKANIYSEDIYKLIPDDINNYDFKLAVDKFLYKCQFKKYAFVKKNENLSETFNSTINPLKAKKSTKLMWFKLLDNFILGKKATEEQLKKINLSDSILD